MIRWTKDGKVDRSTRLVIGAAGPEIEHCANWHDLADALDAAVAALRECKKIGEDSDLSWPDSGNQICRILDDALRRLGGEHD